MRVRFLLSLRIGTGPGVLNGRRRLPKSPASSYGHYRHAAASVIGDQNIVAALVHHHVARPGADRGLLVQERQFTSRPVNAESADGPALFAVVVTNFVHRVQKTPIRVNS